jgi:sugar lactone lactonase YvrE
MKSKAFVLAIVVILALGGTATAEQYISTVAMDGTVINTFAAGVPDDQLVTFVEVDSSGDIWIGKMDSGHGTMQFNPDDEVLRFSPTGAQLQVVKGPTRYQGAIGFDSSFNIYLGAKPDGGALGDDYIYRFSQAGTFDTSFGLLNDDVRDMAITSGNRIFLVTGNVMLLQEYNTSGTRLNNVQINNFIGGFMTLDSSETTIWCYQYYNGPGENTINSYNLSLVGQSSFGLNPIGNANLDGLEVLASGNLLALDGDPAATFYEFTTAGTLVNTIAMPDLTSASGFAIDGSGNLVVVHSNPLLLAADIPTMDGVGFVALVTLLAGVAVILIRRGDFAV